MRFDRQVLATFVALAAVAALAVCRPNNSSGDGDGDVDTDVDSDVDSDVDGDTDSDSDVPPGSVGPAGACRCDSDCQAVDGHGGLCIQGICMNQPTAPCSDLGSTAECPAGSRCWGIDGFEGGICWPDCASFTCAGECDGDGSCVGTAATDGACEPTCSTICSGGGSTTDPPPTGDGSVGAPCQNDDACEGGTCIPDMDDGFIDGYCVTSCSAAGSACGDGGVCTDGLSDTPLCVQPCGEGYESGCREGYGCIYFESAPDTSFCYPYCTTDSECPTEYICNMSAGSYGECVPGAPCSSSAPDGICPAGETCVSGDCVTNCSPSSPSGPCPMGFDCEDGTCVSEAGCPSWQCDGTSAYCHEIIQFSGSTNPSSTEARTSGYYIASWAAKYLRRDLVLAMQWATCEIWARNPGTAPLELMDMTEADGSTPGCPAGDCRHPEGSTHTGNDIDTAYYQTDADNDGQCICGDGTARCVNGYEDEYSNGYYCTVEENIMDLQKQAQFIALLASLPIFRVVGVDDTVCDDLRTEFAAMYSRGEITAETRSRISIGCASDHDSWVFHHHHTHWSFTY